jgi:nitroreductase
MSLDLRVAAAAAGTAFALGWYCARSGGGRRSTTSPGSLDAADVLALIKARRSIFPKDYTGEVRARRLCAHCVCARRMRELALPDVRVPEQAVPRESLELMLEASNWAPTHGKTEPWRFVVIEKDGIEKFFNVCSDAMREQFGPESDKFRAYQQKQEKSKKDKAKCHFIIAICFKRKALPDKVMPEWEEIAATSCAVQNMHLMATSLGIASYWSSGGPLDHALVLDKLGLKGADGDRCLGLFYVGATTGEKIASYRKSARRGPIADKVSYLKA